ncbi:MAG: hypothetical protein AAF385_06870 [Pseudomonadota bacterium]
MGRLSSQKARFALCALLLSQVVACTTLDTVNIADNPSSVFRLSNGDSVDIILRDGQTESFVIEKIDSTSISGASKTVLISNISSVEVKRVDGGKTLGAVGIGIAVAALLSKLLTDEIVDDIRDAAQETGR